MGGQPGLGFGGGGAGSDKILDPDFVSINDNYPLRGTAGGGGGGYGAGGGGNARRQEPQRNIYVQGGRGADGVIFMRYIPDII